MNLFAARPAPAVCRFRSARIFLLLPLLVFQAALCQERVVPARSGQGPDSTQSIPVFDDASISGLRGELESIVAEGNVPGVAVAIVTRDGPVWTGGFGLADVAARQPVTANTLFRMNSVSKSLVALTVLRLVEAGSLDLDAPLADVAPDLAFENKWAEESPVRLAHLLEHTSGFDELHLKEYAVGPELGPMAGALAVNPAPRQARWRPGTRMAYNNGGYAVVAHAIEKTTGLSFSEVVDRQILEPLGMDASGFGIDRVDSAMLSLNYDDTGGEDPTTRLPLIVQPAGGFISSAADMARFVQMFLRRGAPLLGEGTMRRMALPRTTDAARAGMQAGYGLGLYTMDSNGRAWVGHAGGTPSAWAVFAVQPELGVGYAVLMNGNDAGLKKDLDRAIRLFLSTDQSPSPPVNDDVETDLSVYEGTYRQGSSSWSLSAGIEQLFDVQRVRRDSGRLLLFPLLGDAAQSAEAVGRDLFRTPEASGADVVFLRNDEGEITGLRTWDADNIRAGNYERVSTLRAYAPPTLFLFCLVLMMSVLLTTPIRIVANLFRKKDRSEGRWARRLPFLGVATLVTAIVVILVGAGGADGVQVLGTPSLPAIAFCVLTWMFALISVLGLVVTARSLAVDHQVGRFVRLYVFSAALASTVMLVFLGSWGWIGLQTWAF